MKFQKFINWANQIKNNPRSLNILIVLTGLWAIISIWVDLPWLMQVPTLLTPFTPICSLYPLLLTIWYLLYKTKKNIPAWFTTFTFVGCLSYGILAQIYYPFYMSWIGLNFHDVASMFWVAFYGLQVFVIASELKPTKFYQLLLIIAYFAFKDFSDYYFKTFVDFLRPGYPVYIMNLVLISGIVIQASAILLATKLARINIIKKMKT